MNHRSGLPLYADVAQRCSARIIGRYSTSFGAASLMLSARVRPHIANIYGLVRIADEIVDGTAAEAGLTATERRHVLDAFEAETESALQTGYSTNVIVQAFAVTARSAGIGPDLTRPFFRSMRWDLTTIDFDSPTELEEYVYGSAEAVGLMCLAVFINGRTTSDRHHDTLISGARSLGAAFQKVNFLRDLSTDWLELGRSYFPGVDPDTLTETAKTAILDDIDENLANAEISIPLLPRDCRAGVACAHSLFAELSTKLRHTPAGRLTSTRVRVPNPRKISIAAGQWTRSKLTKRP